MNTQDNRQAYIAGLRKLADLLAEHPDLPLPYTGTRDGSGLLWIAYPHHGDVREHAAAFARLIPGTVAKEVRGEDLDLIGSVEGLGVHMIAAREDVCERIVVGQREVTREVPDPDVDVPMVTQTVTEDIVEWRCAPVLAGDAS